MINFWSMKNILTLISCSTLTGFYACNVHQIQEGRLVDPLFKLLLRISILNTSVGSTAA